jgi:ATP-dependent Clp protease ATP-binding subunit ClpA
MDITRNFSDDVQEAIAASHAEAIRLGNNFIGTEHLVLGFIGLGRGPAFDILSARTDVNALADDLAERIRGRTRGVCTRASEMEEGSLVLSPDAERVIHDSLAYAVSETVGADVIFATLLGQDSPVRELLNAAGVTAGDFASRE